MSNLKNDLSKKNFHQLMDEFEAVAAQFDAIEMDIEQALELHKKASDLLDELERRLKQAETAVSSAKA